MKKPHIFSRKRKESGQSLVEFALVLPLFMLILMGIMDFGWLFYNYIGVENSARNAARVACVEYQNTNLKYKADGRVDGPINTYSGTYEFAKYDEYAQDSNLKKNRYETIGGVQYLVSYNQTTDILDAAKTAVAESTTLQDITIAYSYDADSANSNAMPWLVEHRYKGDVKVTVHAKMRCLTPVLGIFGDHMQLNLTSTATYKVEKAPAEDSD